MILRPSMSKPNRSLCAYERFVHEQYVDEQCARPRRMRHHLT
jgi:hypothetical protein